MTRHARATREWRKFISEVLPKGDPLRDLLMNVNVTTDDKATQEDYILCGTVAVVPSDNVACSLCGTPLCRSKQAPQAPKPICLTCVGELEGP
jgi:hypothetical protein